MFCCESIDSSFAEKETTTVPDHEICLLILDYIVGRVIGGMLGKGFITASFNSLFVWSGEIFPTVVRSVGHIMTTDSFYCLLQCLSLST